MSAENTRYKSEKSKPFLKDYVSGLTDGQLHALDMRLKHRLNGDLADAVLFLAESADVDRYLLSAKGFDEFYDMLDGIQKQVEKEARRRHG